MLSRTPIPLPSFTFKPLCSDSTSWAGRWRQSAPGQLPRADMIYFNPICKSKTKHCYRSSEKDYISPSDIEFERSSAFTIHFDALRVTSRYKQTTTHRRNRRFGFFHARSLGICKWGYCTHWARHLHERTSIRMRAKGIVKKCAC